MSTTVAVADCATDEDAAGRRLGSHIRRLRQARGLTLVKLAAATDLSHPFLSQMERGLAQPSLASLRRIAVALGTSPIELIAAAEAPASADSLVEVHRRGGDVIDGGFAAGAARMLAHGSRALHPLEVSGNNAVADEPFVHAEDEFVYVLEGRIDVELDGTASLFEAGDSVYFRGGVSHRWWSPTGDPYRLLVVKQGPGPLRWSRT